MSMDREGRNTSDTNTEIAKLYLRIKEDHRISLLMNDGINELEHLSEIEVDNWYKESHRAMIDMAACIARSNSDLKMKAHAAQLICEIHAGMYKNERNMDYAIKSAGTYEAVALSFARDYLKAAA